MAGAGKEEKDAAPNAPALPNNTSRREIAIIMLPFVSFAASVFGSRASVALYS
jgi:hypothetical protein